MENQQSKCLGEVTLEPGLWDRNDVGEKGGGGGSISDGIILGRGSH